MRRDETLLLDMLLATRKILQFTGELSEDDFRRSELHQSAVIRELLVVGEAARLVSDETKANHPQIPWEQIGGMRNRLTHEYFRMSLEIVWQTVRDDIQPLIAALESLIPPDEA